jgi:hypothetical protein
MKLAEEPSRSMSDRPRLSTDHAIAYQNKEVATRAAASP